MKYDLKEKTTKFGKNIFSKLLILLLIVISAVALIVFKNLSSVGTSLTNKPKPITVTDIKNLFD